ncbi:Histidine kinase-like ATPase domain-containing protein [Xylanibacter ruminicola]|jgi:anti-sigma regulatory factor (Ser/Thr protein kinase)|uniref:Histidine kinase-like ATPase domain-containing protein n=1 Tax=Xylanibacter ruminicola TaxID=839 RepID=A0A1H4EGD1_XYLRU|nr:ATP-binding protein [Xylanibacter ruminicola]MBQ3858588.1 ATP-binding protein [Prevotella sp.]SEA84115.1 Histidine kinase-like ATPase domain-containing protein [Xylanibacter ruminicola]
MTSLHFQPIKGKAPEIIDAILGTGEVAGVESENKFINMVVEEIVVNVVSYAYPDNPDGYLDVVTTRNKNLITFRFSDGGIPFNPLQREPPDITLPLEQWKIGGLGIMMVIKKAEAINYEYTNGENILTVSLPTHNNSKQ